MDQSIDHLGVQLHVMGSRPIKRRTLMTEFSSHDVDLVFQSYFEYEHQMTIIAQALSPLLDSPPIDLSTIGQGTLKSRMDMWPALKAMLQTGTDPGFLRTGEELYNVSFVWKRSTIETIYKMTNNTPHTDT